MAAPPLFQWDRATGRYRRSNGQFISDEQIRQALDAAILRQERELTALADQVRKRLITRAEWHQAMQASVKDAHLYAAALARGGWAQMTPAAYGQVGNTLRKQYAYLARFEGELAAGLSTDGRFFLRVKLYARAARETFERARTQERRVLGDTEERNVLHPADHCAECVELADLGWVPIGTLPPVGTRICGPQCKCRVVTRGARARTAA